MRNFFTNRMDFDDLIFESRNKEYGAYFLRQGYNLNVVISILLGSFIVIFLVLLPYLQAIHKKNDISQQMRPRYVEVKMDNIEPPKEIIVPPPIAPPPPATQAIIKYIAPVVVDTVLAIDKQPPANAEIQASTATTTELVVSSTGNSDELITGKEGTDTDEPFMIVEVKPTFKGGDIEKFREWVQKRVTYPLLAQENGIQGKITLTFVVERDGSVSNVKVVRGVFKDLDEEAENAIKASPKWSPGLQRGRPVRVRYYIPIIFTLGK